MGSMRDRATLIADPRTPFISWITPPGVGNQDEVKALLAKWRDPNRRGAASQGMPRYIGDPDPFPGYRMWFGDLPSDCTL
eukprot:9985364-Heterocapsa_arctica.AAC.1